MMRAPTAVGTVLTIGLRSEFSAASFAEEIAAAVEKPIPVALSPEELARYTGVTLRPRAATEVGGGGAGPAFIVRLRTFKRRDST